MEKKTCPLIESAKCAGAHPGKAECLEGECAWWVLAYTTEGHQFHGCALQVMALAAGRVEP